MSARLLLRIGLVLCAAFCAARRTHAAPLSDGSLPRGSLALAVRAQIYTGTEGRSEALATLSLVVPLDRFAGRRRPEVSWQPEGEPRLAQNEAPSKTSEARASADRLEAELPRAAAVPSESRPAREAPSRPAFVLTAELGRATVAAALRAGGYPAVERRLAGAASRARGSAALPEMRLRAARVLDQSLRLSPTADDPYRYLRAGATNLLFEARLTWKLDRLVFADEELGIERLRAEHGRGRALLAERVLKLLFAWQRARAKAADPELSENQRSLEELSVLESELALDVLTHGWFSATVLQEMALEARVRAPQRPGAGLAVRPEPDAGREARQEPGQASRQAVDIARHACRDPHHTPGPQAARRCAKGVSLTSPRSNEK